MEWLGMILGAIVFTVGVVALVVIERYTAKEAKRRARIDEETLARLQDMSRRRYRAARDEESGT